MADPQTYAPEQTNAGMADVVPFPGQMQSQAPTEVMQRLLQIIATPNIAAVLEPEDLSKLADRVVTEYEIDDASRTDWKERTEAAMDLAMLVAGEKDYPFAGAANVKYPLLTVAALQFNARAYPAIVQGDRVAKAKVLGTDADGRKAKRGERISSHMSWQLVAEMPEWEEDTDRLLVILPIVGCVFRKVYFDPALGRKCSRIVTADRFVINYRARSLDDCPRYTERLYLYPHEIEERIRDGRFVAFEYGTATPQVDEDGDDDRDNQSPGDDEDAPHLFLEQHRLWDLDEDGYPEPYIVTVHKETQKVCRIVANFTEDTVRLTADGSKVAAIRRQSFFVKYGFLPSPDGGFYGLGLGWLLKDNNEAVNTTLNLMLDSAHAANTQGGFVSAALGIREKTIRLKINEFRVINNGAVPLNQAIYQVKFDGPSAVLFQLLGLLVEMGKELASTKDVLTGDSRPNQTATATLALIEQGLKVFNAIFKRVHRSVKAELDIHARLNSENLDAESYNAFFDDQQEQFDPKADYNLSDMDILPVSDPTVSSQMQKLAKAQVVAETGTGNPLINQEEMLRRQYEAAEIQDIDKLFVPPPPPEEQQAQADLAKRAAVAAVRVPETLADKQEAEAGVALHSADVADAATNAPPEQPVLPPPPPQPTPHELRMQELAVANADLKNVGQHLQNQNHLADLKAKDVVVSEDGDVKSRTDEGFKALAEINAKLADLIVQQGNAQAEILRQGFEAMLKGIMAPTVLIRDENGKAQAGQKVIN